MRLAHSRTATTTLFIASLTLGSALSVAAPSNGAEADSQEFQTIEVDPPLTTGDNEYIVEMVLYKNNTVDTKEIAWLANVEPTLDELAQPPQSSSIIRPVPRSTELTTLVDKLNTSKHYTVIKSLAWIQPYGENKKNHPVRISYQWEGHTIDGTVNLYKTRALHIRSDIWVTRTPQHAAVEANLETNTELVRSALASDSEVQTNLLLNTPDEQPATSDYGWQPFGSSNQPQPAPETSVPSYAPVTAQLNETRRIRRKQWNYFDHPSFGMMIRILRSSDRS